MKGGRLQLPSRPNLQHLKDQAKDLFKSGAASSISDAQVEIARLYGFASWPKLTARVDFIQQLHSAYASGDVERLRTLLDRQVTDLMTSGDTASRDEAQTVVASVCGLTSWEDVEAGLSTLSKAGAIDGAAVRQLKRAIEADDVSGVKTLMTSHPALHSAPMGYGRNGPLTCVAECDVPPSAARLAVARWMVENGSDVHQGGDGPLMRAALDGGRIPMMELLVSRGADVNAMWDGRFPILFAACEAVNPRSMKWLLEHGANPNASDPEQTSALDYVIGAYVRSPELGQCIDLLVTAGGTTKYDKPGVLDVLCGRLARLAAVIEANPAVVRGRFSELDFGASGGRRLTLKGATLLHVAAEYRSVGAVNLLLDRGADINAPASIDESGAGGQTAIFHAVTQRDEGGVPVTRLLIDRGADLSVRAKLPGHYERPREVVECTPLGYALRFQSLRSDNGQTVALLRERGAVE